MSFLTKFTTLIYFFIPFYFLNLFPTQAATPPTLSDYWNHQAYFQFVKKNIMPTLNPDGSWRSGPSMNGGIDIEVRGNTWYLFHREYNYKDVVSGSACDKPDTLYARVVVRQSTDKGLTWSAGTPILEPADTYYDYCANADGDAYFDASTTTWHYIYQCLNSENGNLVWGLCHATRQNANPVGAWVKDTNGIVKSGDLWRRICLPGTKCNQISGGNNVADEGTPEFVGKIGDSFYVTFHGYTPSGGYGYRGIASTKDFKTWAIVAPDSIADKYSCANWQIGYDAAGCIGAGAASLIREDPYYYMLVELPDKNLACASGQKWPFGLFRSTALSNVTWDSYPDNPMVYSSMQHPPDSSECWLCNIQYMRLFHDADNTVYLAFLKVWGDGRTTGLYLYKLVANAKYIDYQFREDLRDVAKTEYTQSDTISRFNSEIRLFNTTSNAQNYESGAPKSNLVFNGTNSYAQSLWSKPFLFENNFTLSLDLKLNSLPPTNSARLAGVENSYQLEAYFNRQLCAWVFTTDNQWHDACSFLPVTYNQFNNYLMTYQNGKLILYINGQLAASNTVGLNLLLQPDKKFLIGSSASPTAGVWGSFNGELKNLWLDDKAYVPPACQTCSSAPAHNLGNANCDAQINILDFLKWKREFVSHKSTNLTADFNCDNTINLNDFTVWRNNL